LLFCCSFFFFIIFPFVLFSLLYSSVGTLLWFYFLFCIFVSFVFSWLISFWVSFACLVAVFYFALLVLFWFLVCVCVCVYVCVCVCAHTCIHMLIFPLLFCFFRFCFNICLGFFFIPFITMMNGLWGIDSLTGSLAWASRVEALSPGYWTEDSWPQGLLISERSHKGLHPNPRPSSTQLPVAPSTAYLMPNNKQDRNTNQIISRQAT